MKNLKLNNLKIALIAITVFSASCKNERNQQDREQMDAISRPDTTIAQQAEVRAYTGVITPLNEDFYNDAEVSGTVAMRIENNIIRISVVAEGLEPNMMHLQHLQASEGTHTQCPGTNADENNDGIIDVTEISDDPEEVKIIPLNMGPSSLKVDVPTYPSSNVNGEIEFETYVDLDSLRTAVREKYGIKDVDFTRFTYIIQGVGEDVSIPETMGTIEAIPPYATVPVGCARLEETDVDD